jgi:hypothetical protein
VARRNAGADAQLRFCRGFKKNLLPLQSRLKSV